MYNQITSNKRKSVFLVIIFFIVLMGLAYVFGLYWGDTYAAVILAVVVSTIMSLVSYYSGDKIALAASRAVPIKKEDNPYVWRLVENLSITAGLPMPKVYIIKDEAMNAFATGRDPQHASIAMTTGIINALENEELEGVIAHEMSHVKNYDIRLMMLVIVCVGAITLLADWMLRSSMWRRRGNSRENGGGGGIILLIALVLAILSPIFAQLIQLAVSRRREYLADASGALLTRYPEGLARALEKISQQNVPMQSANKATAHLFFSNPFGAKNVSKLFSTHPPIQDRIKALRQM